MVFWNKRGREESASPEPEETAVDLNENSASERGTENVDVEHPESALGDVLTVPVEIDGVEYEALSLYELPGLKVMEAQQATDEQKLPALWELFRLAMPQEGIEAAELLGFMEFQSALMGWATTSSVQATEVFMERGKAKLRRAMGLAEDGSEDPSWEGLDVE